MLKKLSLIGTNIQYLLMINQYINKLTSLFHISRIAFIANYDIRTLKKSKNKMLFIGLVSISNPKNQYRIFIKIIFHPLQ
jgi:hypothetical protein